MEDERETPSEETRFSEPVRAEILLVGLAWALFVFTLLAVLRLWAGGFH